MKFIRCLSVVVCLASSALGAEDRSSTSLVNLKEWEGRVTKQVLKNGLTVLVVEQHDVPTVSFVTYARVGSSDEVVGITGMAHMFEHMAFKGTTTIGAKDYEAERRVMDDLERAHDEWKAEKQKGPRSNPDQVKQAYAQFRKLVEQASRLATNEYTYIVERAGAQNLNAFTSADQTVYHYSLPSNKLELWMALESERFLHPVLRDFYKERDVVMEERRRSYEDKPTGKLYLQMVNLAYEAHPYGVGTIGHASDLRTISRRQAEEFYREHYTPDRLVIVISGDVNPQEALAMAEAYFGRLPARTTPLRQVETVEPPQQGEKRLTLELPFQPFLMMVFHVEGGLDHPDRLVYDVLSNILTSGRTSKLERLLTQEKQVTTEINSSVGPGRRYPGLLFFSAPVAPGKSLEALEAALWEGLVSMGRDVVDAETLEKAKRQKTVQVLETLQSHHGVAMFLAFAEGLRGEWREAFKDLDRIQAVTAEDVRRVAAKMFVASNRTVGVIKPKKRP